MPCQREGRLTSHRHYVIQTFILAVVKGPWSEGLNASDTDGPTETHHGRGWGEGGRGAHAAGWHGGQEAVCRREGEGRWCG